jgi:hypothetical protein
MSFPGRYVPALAMASIVVVVIVTSIVRVQGIIGVDGGGGMAMGGTTRVDDGPPSLDESRTTRIRDHGADDDVDDDGTIPEDGYSSPRILQAASSRLTTMPIDAPAPTIFDMPAPGDVLVKDTTIMPSGFVGLRPESDSLFDTSISVGQVCVADPERCGCPNVYQTDYRGLINITRSGQPCLRWDDEILNQALIITYGWDNSQYPDEHRESNFCRNGGTDSDGTWCFVKASMMPVVTVFNYCNVPVCGMLTPTASPTVSAIPTCSSGPTMTGIPSGVPSSSSSPTPGPLRSSVPTLTSSPTQQCTAADKSTCGCEVVRLSDYRGTINMTENGVPCERWDSNIFGLGMIQDYPDAELVENYCRSIGGTVPYCYPSFEQYGIIDMLKCDVPKCDPCSCMPSCGQPNEEKCGCPSALQAEACCDEDDSRCKCLYLKNACHTNLQNNSTDFCEEAQDVCCKDNDAACKCGYWKEACNVGMHDVRSAEDFDNFSYASWNPCEAAARDCCTDSSNPSCKCATYDNICSEYQSESLCELAASVCCMSLGLPYKYSDVLQNVKQCHCDFYTYNENVYGFKSAMKSSVCFMAATGDVTDEKSLLKEFYYQTGGDYWYNKTGWLDEKISLCQWFGLTCNYDGLLVKIELKRNNLTGSDVFFEKVADSIMTIQRKWTSLRYVKALDLSESNLSGRVDGHYLRHLSMLEHIDISNNAFSGYADMFFSPSTIYANFSHITSLV